MENTAWRACRPGQTPAWLGNLEPLTTGLLGQQDLKLWCAQERAALGIRAGGVVYPVWPDQPDPVLEASARPILDRVGELWCLMGPAPWVERTEGLMPSSRIQRRVLYDFLVRPASSPPIPEGSGDLRPATPGEADTLFPLQEAYEKEEVLFDPSEFHSMASRVHWAQSLRLQQNVVLWENSEPVAKAGTMRSLPSGLRSGESSHGPIGEASDCRSVSLPIFWTGWPTRGVESAFLSKKRTSQL
jgi:hypothetical protein